MGLESGTYVNDLVSSNPVGSTDPKSQGDDHLRLIKAVLKATFPNADKAVYLDQAQADVASSSPNIGAASTNFVRITGTTTITSFGTVAAGVWRFVRFAAALTLTHNATSLILPGAADIATAANDTMLVVSLGSGNWLVLFYQKATGQSVVASSAAAISFTPTGGIAATTVQTALAELDTEKAAATVGQGQHTLWIPAGALQPNETSGPAVGLLETTTNKVQVTYLAFDATSAEYAQFQVQMPKSWNEDTLVAEFVWMHPSTTVNFDVVWGLRAVSFDNGDALEAAFGTAVEVTDTGGVTNTVYHSPESGALTVAGAPAAESLVTFQAYRVAANVADTLAVDAYLLGVRLHYTTNAANDD